MKDGERHFFFFLFKNKENVKSKKKNFCACLGRLCRISVEKKKKTGAESATFLSHFISFLFFFFYFFFTRILSHDPPSIHLRLFQPPLYTYIHIYIQIPVNAFNLSSCVFSIRSVETLSSSQSPPVLSSVPPLPPHPPIYRRELNLAIG